MNYYIQGDAAKAEQIKAAFEKLGYKNRCNYTFASRGNIYFTISKDNDLYALGIDFIELFRNNPDYQELELPVEPKFKVGDWIVYEDGNTFAGGSKSVQVKAVEDDRYIFTHNTNGSCRFIDRNCRLWSIADAKNGDVLVCYSEVKGSPIEQAGIFKQYVGIHGGCSNAFLAHTGIDWDGNIIINGYMGSTDILPATKEQHDRLFAKMKEAGYEWDADKKELKKVSEHYDIANFKPKQWVLVRDDDEWEWALTRFSYLSDGSASLFVCINGASFQQCITFEGNEHLLGTTDMPSEEYINW